MGGKIFYVNSGQAPAPATTSTLSPQDIDIYDGMYGKGNWQVSAGGRAMPIRTHARPNQSPSGLSRKVS